MPTITGEDPELVAKLYAEMKAREARTARRQPTPLPELIRTPFRFRRHLAALIWPAALLGAVVAYGRAPLAPALGVVWLGAAVAVCAVRSMAPFPRIHTQAAALATALVASAVVYWGPRPWAVLGLAAQGAAGLRWVQHYTWRPGVGERKPAAPDDVKIKWAELAAEQHWAAWLGDPEPIPDGTVYPIICRGSKTQISKITGSGEAIAATYGRDLTEVFPEPSRTPDKGRLVMLSRATLEPVREWAGVPGATIDPATGLAVVGRFPDGKPITERYLVLPRSGVKHGIVGGADGSGKSGTLNLMLANSAYSGLVCPVILDPQEGQALGDWAEFVPYARGADECLAYLHGIYAALLDRSRLLAGLPWRLTRRDGKPWPLREDGRTSEGKARRGMGWFNPYVLPPGYDLPIVELTIDEAPILLSLDGAAGLLLDIIKLGRKAGVRVRLAAQVPSISELGKSELRSLLNASAVYCHRTGDKVTGGMVGLKAEPSDLPTVFADGSDAVGLLYARTVEMRPATPGRIDFVPDAYEVAERAAEAGLIRPMDDQFGRVFRRVLAGREADVAALARAGDAAARVKLAVLAELADGPVNRTDVLQACARGGGQLSAIVGAIGELSADGRVVERGGRLEAIT
jgi:hypothetical protein